MRPAVDTDKDHLVIQARAFAETDDSRRIASEYWNVSAGLWRRGANAITKRWRGLPLPTDPDEQLRVLDSYCLQLYDIEDAINSRFGRDPEQMSPPRLGWEPLIRALRDEGIHVYEGELIDLPFVFEFSERLLAEIDSDDGGET